MDCILHKVLQLYEVKMTMNPESIEYQNNHMYDYSPSEHIYSEKYSTYCEDHGGICLPNGLGKQPISDWGGLTIWHILVDLEGSYSSSVPCPVIYSIKELSGLWTVWHKLIRQNKC